jgi:hypothetical protein
MKKSLLALAAMTAIGGVVRAKTRDVAFAYRMGAGFAGDVNRTHPFSATPNLQDATTPVRLYGDPCVVNTAANTVRGFTAGDTAITRMYGVAVRPFPTQQSTTSQGLGAGAASTSQPLDVLDSGFIMVKCNVGTPTKDGLVYVWCAASSGSHVQGGFEAAATGGSTAAIANARFNGPPDANGICEIRVFPQ